MAKEYSNISELIREVIEYKIIDLIPYVMGIDQELLDALVDHTPGLYIPGSIEPVFIVGQKYYLSTRNKETEITFNDIYCDSNKTKLLPDGEIYNEKRRLVMKRSIYQRVKSQFKSYPDVPAKGCEAAIAVIIDYLNTLCKHTSVANRQYDLRKLVKEDYQFLLDKQTYESAFDDLVLEIMRFVGKDSWNLYFYKVIGTSLIIEKGLDFRILDWHMSELKRSEAYDHDFGGIYDGYATEFGTRKRR